jgi:membrane protein YqaA with SNARE-associated domain
MDKVKRLITHAVKLLQYYIDRVWYLPVLSLLACLDNFLVVVPTDGILISSSMLKPGKWFYFGVFIAVGSVMGAITLAYIVDVYGIQVVEKLFPNIQSSSTWLRTQKFFDEYGLWLLFAVSVTPFTQQPAIILAVLAGVSLYKIALVAFAGRLIKFLLMAYIGSHAPHLLKKMWGVQDELKEVGIE